MALALPAATSVLATGAGPGDPYANEPPLVPCNGPDCEISDFFLMLAKIYNFLVFWIAGPLAILAITAGGIMIMVSAGNQTFYTKGRQILMISVIGLFLVFCSWLIVNVILTTLGYKGTWWQF